MMHLHNYYVLLFIDMAPSFKAWETHRYLKNLLDIVCARGGGLLDHPYVPCHPPSVPPKEEHLVGHLTNYCHQMSRVGLYILFLYCYIEYHISLVSVLKGVVKMCLCLLVARWCPEVRFCFSWCPTCFALSLSTLSFNMLAIKDMQLKDIFHVHKKSCYLG